MPAPLVALGSFLVCIVAGAILLAIGIELIGLIVMVASVPVAFVAWISAGDRL
jgi:hypothetical protein